MRWRIRTHDHELVRQICATSGVSPVIAQILAMRDLTHPDQVGMFLDMRLTCLHPPLSLPGVEQAVDLIHEAIAAGKKIVVYGDYDCDGITATAILYRGLKLLGANAHYFVPNRMEDGYGLNGDQLRRLRERGADLLVTVDCGVASLAEARLAREIGLQLIVTDHHQFAAELPEVAALVHPALPGADYPFKDLCGAGVAFKLAWALCQRRAGSEKLPEPMRNFLFSAIALATIGTVADVVPLLGENRVLVHHGLRLLATHGGVGFQALAAEAKLGSRREFSAEDIAFFIAPRLNASGRLAQAQLGVELLVTEDPQRAAELAAYINNLNQSRDSLERSINRSAQKMISENFDPENDPALVLADAQWHRGVIGIVAGRLAEKYNRPTIVISTDVDPQKVAVGSARSASQLNLYEALGACSRHLVGFGGHAAAAGLQIMPEAIDAFRAEFCEYVASQIAPDQREAELQIDVEAALCQLNLETVLQLEKLAPFGQANPRPVLCATGVRLAAEPKTMGADGRHLDLRIAQEETQLRAVAFGKAEWIEKLNAAPEALYDFAFKPVINDFGGRGKVELQLIDFRPRQAV